MCMWWWQGGTGGSPYRICYKPYILKSLTVYSPTIAPAPHTCSGGVASPSSQSSLSLGDKEGAACSPSPGSKPAAPGGCSPQYVVGSPAIGSPSSCQCTSARCHWDEALASPLSPWLDFGFSRMNLLRRSVSELAWATPYPSPAGPGLRSRSKDPCPRGLVLHGASWQAGVGHCSDSLA